MPRRRRSSLVLAVLEVLVGVILAAVSGPADAGPSDPRCRELAEKAVKAIDDAERSRNPARANDAVQLVETAIRICPEDATLRFWLAVSLIVARDEDRARGALVALDQALVAEAAAMNRPAASTQNDPRTLYVQAQLHFTFGNNVSQTLERLDRLRVRSPDFLAAKVAALEFESRLAYSAQLRRVSDYFEADKQIQLAIVAAGDNTTRRDFALRNRGQILREGSRFNESEEVFRDLAKRYPKDAIVRYALASVLADQLRFDEASSTWKEVLRLSDDAGAVSPAEKDQLIDVPMRFGVSLVFGGRLAEGRERIRDYVARYPLDSRGWYYLGLIAFKHANPPDLGEAVRAFEKAYALDPLCEFAPRELLAIYTTARPDPERAAVFKEFLLEENRKKRARELEKRKSARPDHTAGCE